MWDSAPGICSLTLAVPVKDRGNYFVNLTACVLLLPKHLPNLGYVFSLLKELIPDRQADTVTPERTGCV